MGLTHSVAGWQLVEGPAGVNGAAFLQELDQLPLDLVVREPLFLAWSILLEVGSSIELMQIACFWVKGIRMDRWYQVNFMQKKVSFKKSYN